MRLETRRFPRYNDPLNSKNDRRVATAMLKGIPSILPPELLKIMMEMGHGDTLVIGDGNFPAAA